MGTWDFAIDSDAVRMALNLSSFAMLLLGLLLFPGVSAESPGCIKEDYANYWGNDIADRLVLASPQACADYCASVEGGLFWAYVLPSGTVPGTGHIVKHCFVKNSDSGRRHNVHVVSGTRACGLSNRTTSSQLKAVRTVVSQQSDDFPAHQCADSRTTTICVVPEAPAPWLALDLGREAHVDRVEISSREDCCGERLSNFQVRVTDSLPSSGEEMFREGVLLNSYNGPAVNGQKITLGVPASGPPLVGRYVLLQKDNAGLSGDDRQLHVADFAAFGGLTTSATTTTGLDPLLALLICLVLVCCRGCNNSCTLQGENKQSQ